MDSEALHVSPNGRHTVVRIVVSDMMPSPTDLYTEYFRAENGASVIFRASGQERLISIDLRRDVRIGILVVPVTMRGSEKAPQNPPPDEIISDNRHFNFDPNFA
jgi:hypothetical protein